MKQFTFIEKFIQCAAELIFLPQIKPFLEIIPSLYRKIKSLTRLGKFENLMKEHYSPIINELLFSSSPIDNLFKEE